MGDIGFGFWILILTITYGFFIWVGGLFILAVVETVFIRTRSTESTVLIILFLEVLIPLIGVMVFADPRDIDLGLTAIGALTIGQTIRWFYLKRTGRMFNSAERK
jgi:hypothetical protein